MNVRRSNARRSAARRAAAARLASRRSRCRLSRSRRACSRRSVIDLTTRACGTTAHTSQLSPESGCTNRRTTPRGSGGWEVWVAHARPNLHAACRYRVFRSGAAHRIRPRDNSLARVPRAGYSLRTINLTDDETNAPRARHRCLHTYSSSLQRSWRRQRARRHPSRALTRFSGSSRYRVRARWPG